MLNNKNFIKIEILIPNLFRKFAPVETIKWRDKQSECIARYYCNVDFINFVKDTPGTESLVLYLNSLTFYNYYHDRKMVNKQLLKKYSSEELIQYCRTRTYKSSIKYTNN